MKLDHFQGVPTLKNSPNRPSELQIPTNYEIPNLRNVPNLPFLYGVGQPSLDGIKCIVSEMFKKLKPEHIIWSNSSTLRLKCEHFIPL